MHIGFIGLGAMGNAMAKRMNAKMIEPPASHLSPISYPDAIASVILEAAAHPSL